MSSASSQHAEDIELEQIQKDIKEHVIYPTVPEGLIDDFHRILLLLELYHLDVNNLRYRLYAHLISVSLVDVSVDKALEYRNDISEEEIEATGAGDQGLMFGYATNVFYCYLNFTIWT
jgi:S-adenosylmethionine synthetase